ncbi:hypothetical protein N0V93_010358 [Gnomoniopsis smithogilvyi]|uniref:Uncharacterized protein n=1 Tax=Gnomoniopsis smithogilvyi TaxID=1191159 RepID=A0A9W8YJX8_9PEZI|nr:hypothetical protein N0V93_010358 [Gnomoniopsis smithogilvyi]
MCQDQEVGARKARTHNAMTPDNRDGPVSIQTAADKNEQAMDQGDRDVSEEEDSDVDDNFTQLQRIQSAKRREGKLNNKPSTRKTAMWTM